MRWRVFNIWLCNFSSCVFWEDVSTRKKEMMKHVLQCMSLFYYTIFVNDYIFSHFAEMYFNNLCTFRYIFWYLLLFPCSPVWCNRIEDKVWLSMQVSYYVDWTTKCYSSGVAMPFRIIFAFSSFVRELHFVVYSFQMISTLVYYS